MSIVLMMTFGSPRVISQASGEPADQRHADVWMHQVIRRGGHGKPHQPVQQPLLRHRRNRVAVQREQPAVGHRELHLLGREPHVQLFVPEPAPPAVVIAAHHGDREAPRQALEGRGNPEPFAGNHPAVGEPELEEIAVDQQPIAYLRHPLQEFE